MHQTPDKGDTPAASAAGVSEKDDQFAESVCPNRPGRRHELYRRSHDGTMFCRDCGWGWHDRGWFCEEECDHAAGVYMCEQADGTDHER